MMFSCKEVLDNAKLVVQAQDDQLRLYSMIPQLLPNDAMS